MGLTSFRFTSVALDTNIFINALSEKQSISVPAEQVLEKISKESPVVYISVLVFEEFFIRIFKDNLDKRIAYYEDYITGGGFYTVVNVDRRIARQAAKIRAKYRAIKAPDAIHIASAQEVGAKIFLTFDRRIPRKIDRLSVVTP